jgi:hypothetical protein
LLIRCTILVLVLLHMLRDFAQFDANCVVIYVTLV